MSRRMILVGQLAPGEKLAIGTRRKGFDTGASPVREALGPLTSNRPVERIDQHGFRAAEARKSNFEEILGLRCYLEEMALRQSIANSAGTWEERIVLTHHRMLRQDRDNVEAFEVKHKSFHMALLSECRSPILMKFCNQLYDLNIRHRYLAGKTRGYPKRDVNKEHADILAAAIDRDADLAEQRLVGHDRQTGVFLVGLHSG